MQGKTKVSVSVHSRLLREVERVAGAMSRSAVFEQALAGWLRQRRRRQLEDAIEEYYRSVSASEKGEDDGWASLGDDTARRSWDEPRR